MAAQEATHFSTVCSSLMGPSTVTNAWNAVAHTSSGRHCCGQDPLSATREQNMVRCVPQHVRPSRLAVMQSGVRGKGGASRGVNTTTAHSVPASSVSIHPLS